MPRQQKTQDRKSSMDEVEAVIRTVDAFEGWVRQAFTHLGLTEEATIFRMSSVNHACWTDPCACIRGAKAAA